VYRQFKYLFITTGIFIILLLFFIRVKSGIILSKLNNVISKDLNKISEELERLSKEPDIVSLRFKFSLNEKVIGAENLLKGLVNQFEQIEAALIYEGEEVYLKEVNPHFKKIKVENLINLQKKVFRFRGRSYLILKESISGLFTREIAKIGVLVNISDYFTLISLNHIKITSMPINIETLGQLNLFSKDHKLSFTIDHMIHTRRADLRGEETFFNYYYEWVNLFLVFIILILGAWIANSLNRRYALLSRLKRRILGQKGVEEDPFGSINHEIFPIMNNMKNELFNIKRYIQISKKSKTMPDDHTNIKDTHVKGQKIDDEKISKEHEELLEKTMEEGRKSAIVDDPTIPTAFVYDFDYADSIQEYNEKVFQVVETKEEKAQEFTAGKTRMIDSDEEKKIVYDKSKTDNFVNINI